MIRANELQVWFVTLWAQDPDFVPKLLDEVCRWAAKGLRQSHGRRTSARPARRRRAECGDLDRTWRERGGLERRRSAILVFRGTEIPLRIERVDLATGRRELFREIAPVDRSGFLQIEQVSLAASATAYAYGLVRRTSQL